MMKRVTIYLCGVLLVSLGIVLCKKCSLGISPVSCIPYVLEDCLPFSFGTLTIFFHLVNIVLQMILLRRFLNARLLLQVPLALLFGRVIDGFQRIVVFNNTLALNQWIALALSIFFTALGMVCMISMNLIQNPPDGLVRVISQKTGKELGKIKIGYDILCVAAAVIIGLLTSGKIRGMGAATILSALLVGRTVTWIKQAIARIKQ
ncbi:MAG: DUF6198 family protein [Fusicatenibacter sp.]|nr:DUF6198 family protein [Fusicatenibacter sp.]